MSELKSCHVCGGQLLPVRAHSVVERITSDCKPWRGEGQLAHCLVCGLVQKPVSDVWRREVREIYAAYAMYQQGGGAEQASFDAATGGSMARSQRIVAWLTDRGQLCQKGTLLDIGCGNGAFLKAFGQANPGWQMAGLELDARNKDRIESIPGVIRLHVGPLENLSQKFDLIVMVHALEHIPGPDEFLREVALSLKPGGRLLIQVPDIQGSPFDLLIVDHCTHFSAAALDRIVSFAGYQVRQLDSACVAKELTLLAEPVAADMSPGAYALLPGDDARTAEGHAEWLSQVLQQGLLVLGQVGIFGSSISGTWLASALGAKVDFFVDEDPNRTGRAQLGKPIYSPAQAPDDKVILMPMRRDVAAAIVKRLKLPRLRLVLPPPSPFKLPEQRAS